jgi:hypothetical protein
MSDKGVEVTITFPKEIPTDVQGPILLMVEKELRRITKQDVRLVKALQGDDSKLRKFMTIKQREAL